jgi:hypothetical protein
LCQPKPTVQIKQQTWQYHLVQVSRAEPPRSIKKGGAASGGDPCAEAEILRVSWLYDWSPQPPICPGSESIAMVWDGSVVNKQLGGNSKMILGFNEPDACAQAHLSIEQAIPLWNTLEELHPDRLLVSPAMLQGGLNQGDLDPCGVPGMWLPVFRERFRMVTGHYPRFSGIAFHCYALNDDWLADCNRRLAQHIAWSKEWYAPLGVIISEYGFVPNAPVPHPYSVDQAIQREIQWIAEVEANSGVWGYAHFVFHFDDSTNACAWISGCEKFMLFRGTKLTRFGEMYAR